MPVRVPSARRHRGLQRFGLIAAVFVAFACSLSRGTAFAGEPDAGEVVAPDGGVLDGGTTPTATPTEPEAQEEAKPPKRRYTEPEALPAPKPQCTDDDQCGLGNICLDGQCRSVRRLTKFVPPFYFHNPRHHSGYSYVPPFYFQHWTHDAKTDSDTKVVPLLLFSQHTDKKEVSTRVWPIIFAKTYLDHGKKVGTQAGVVPLFWWQSYKGRQHGALPLLLTGWQRDPARDFTELLVAGLGYYKRERDQKTRVLFPLYWDKEKQGSRFATLFPLYWYQRNGLDTRTVFFPLYWRFHNDKSGSDNTLVLPLFDYARLRNGRRSVVVSLLGGYERDRDAQRSQLFLLAPPFYHRRDKELALDLLLPIFARWKSATTGRSGVYAGPFVHVSDPEGSTSTFFPIYWRIYDRRTQAQTHVLFPVGGYQQRPGFKAGAVGPVFAWSRDGSDGKPRGWGAGLAPLLFFGHSGTRTHASLLPAFWWSRDSATGQQLTAVGPLFVRNNPPTHGTDVGLLPLLWFGKEDHRAYAYVAPIFWYRKTPTRTTVVAGPVYYSHDGGHHDLDAGFAPLVFYHHHDDQRSLTVLPFIYHVANGADSTTVVLPFAHARRGTTVTDALFPLGFVQRKPSSLTVGTLIGGFRREGGHSLGVFGPYVYSRNEATKTSTHVLFPLAFVRRSPQMDLTAVFPIAWDVRNGTQRDSLLVPLFWHRRGGYTDLDVVVPLFLRAKNERSTTFVIGPVFARKVQHGWTQAGMLGVFSFGQKREGNKVARFVGGPGFYYQRNDFTGQRRFLLGPIFDWHRADGYTSGLFPLVFAARRGTSTYAVTPIYYHQSDRATGLSLNVIGPLYWGRSNGQVHAGLAPLFFGQYGQGRSKTVIFPLLYYARKAVGSTLVTPLGGYSSYDGGYKALIGPLYIHRDRLTHSAWLFPIIYHGVNRLTNATTTVAFPLYLDREDPIDGTRVQAFTPLVWRYRSVERTVTLGLPLVFDAKVHGESRSTGVLPFFIRHRSEISKSSWWTVPPLLLWARERHDDQPGRDFVFFPLIWRFGGKERSSTVGFPLVWDFKRGENRTTVVFPIMARWTREDGDRLLVLNTYYRKGKGVREGTWSLNVIPFFDVSRPRPHDFEWNFLEGLIGYSRLGRNRTLKLFWLIPISLAPVPASNLSWWSNTTPDRRVDF